MCIYISGVGLAWCVARTGVVWVRNIVAFEDMRGVALGETAREGKGLS